MSGKLGSLLALAARKQDVAATALLPLRVKVQAQRAVSWPHFAGSAIRGTWGHVLRELACLTGSASCQGCARRHECAYGASFESAPAANCLHPSFRNGLPAYIIKTPALRALTLQAGDTVGFELFLLPPAQPHQALLAEALRRAGGRLLVDGAFALQVAPGRPLPVSRLVNPVALASASVAADTAAALRLDWQTPLRLQNQGRLLRDAAMLDGQILVRALLRRHLQWCQLSGQEPVAAELFLHAAKLCTLDAGAMRWHELARVSSRQGRRLPLGGLLGSVVVQGSAPVIDCLQQLVEHVQPLCVGKETAFGLGRYQCRRVRC